MKANAYAPKQEDEMKTIDPYNDQSENIDSQSSNHRGPLLAQDQESIQNNIEFITDTQPLRKVHTKGWGASGYFQVYKSMYQYTVAKFLQDPKIKTPVECRYSYAVSNPGTPDTSRNVRALSTKLHTKEGVYDLLCNSIPVFSVWDGARFPESIKAFQPSPKTNLINPDRFWAFVSRAPESMQFVTWLYSDIGTSYDLTSIRYFGVNTYSWVNADGQRKYIKYHWLPEEERLHTASEALKAGENNPDIAGKYIFDQIISGESIKYELCVQIMNPQDESILDFDPLKCIYEWPQDKYPLTKVGKLVLNEIPQDYYNHVEKLAFSPVNLVNGIEPSNDPMLQMRISGPYEASHRHRGAEMNPKKKLRVEVQQNKDIEFKYGNFEQAGELFKSFERQHQDRVINNIANELKHASEAIRGIVIDYMYKCDENYGSAVKERINQI